MLANIQILFNARANPLDIRQANSNLLELFERKECFFELMQLLSQSSENQSLLNDVSSRSAYQFCITTLYNKVRKHWYQLNEEERVNFITFLGNYYFSNPFSHLSNKVRRILACSFPFYYSRIFCLSLHLCFLSLTLFLL
jgi:hypothetical protein